MTGQYYETAGGADVKKPLFSIFWMERPARRRKYNERTAAYCHHPGRKRDDGQKPRECPEIMAMRRAARM